MINYDHELFNINISSSERPKPGALLISEPFLREEYFNHSVILLVEYEPDSTAMGIVMNHPTNYTLGALIEGITRKESITVYCGGPMSCDRLYFIHTLGEELIPGARKLSQGIYIGGDFKSVIQYLNAGYPIDGYIRFFVGYSGWGSHQLNEELRTKVWAVAPPDTGELLLTGDQDAYWHRYVRSLGNEFRGWRYHPRNPQCN